jgi:hypothetical protein
MIENKRTQRARADRAWLWVALLAAIGLGLATLSHVLADAPGSGLSDGGVSPMARRGFIGLPDVQAFSLQNISDEPADITVGFHLPDGTLLAGETISETLPAESVRVFEGPAELTDSARITHELPTSDMPLFGANYGLSSLGSEAYLGMDLSGAPSGGPQLWIPLIVKNADSWYSRFVVQNRGTSATDATVAFIDQYGTIFTQYTFFLPASGTYLVDLSDMSFLMDGFVGSALITSSYEPIAVASVHSYNDSLGLRSAHRGVSDYEADTVLVAPALFNGSNSQSSEIWVQNIEPFGYAEVQVSYSDGVTSTASIPPYAMHRFDQSTEGHAPGWSGGAIISSTMDILLAAVVNVNASGSTGRWSYTVPGLSSTGRTLAFPLLFDQYQGWASDIYLHNPNSAEVQVTPRYVSPAGFVHCTETVTVATHSTFAISQAGLPPTFNRSMGYFTATQPLAAVMGATNDGTSGTSDRHLGYSAAHLPPAVAMPDTCDTIRQVFLPAVIKQ